MKRIYSLSLALATATTPLFATWDGSAALWNKGDGSAENPFLIENEAHFAYFQKAVTDGEGYEGKYFRLEADLDMDGKEMSTIGIYDDYTLDDQQYYESKAFLGTFDGAYHIIDNLTVNFAGEEAVGGCGLFAVGRASTTIQNLILGKNVTVNALETTDCGGIIGVACGSTIKNCHNKGTVNGGSFNTGGIVGTALPGTAIDGCAFSGTVIAHSFSGGIVGITTTTTVTNCYNKGEISAEGAYYAAGIVSWADDDSKVEQCYAIGKVTAEPGSSWLPGQSPVCAEFERSTAANCFYVAELCGCEPLAAQQGVSSVTADELKSDATLAALNDEANPAVWAKGNDGFPVLAWESNSISAVESAIVESGCSAKAIGGQIVASANGQAVLSIYDCSGRLIYSTTFEGSTSHNTSAGIYVVTVSDGTNTAVYKLAL